LEHKSKKTIDIKSRLENYVNWILCVRMEQLPECKTNMHSSYMSPYVILTVNFLSEKWKYTSDTHSLRTFTVQMKHLMLSSAISIYGTKQIQSQFTNWKHDWQEVKHYFSLFTFWGAHFLDVHC